MTRATAEERALARSNLYRLLGLAFSYPSAEVVSELERALEVAGVGAELIDEATARAVEQLTSAFDHADRFSLETAYQQVFTLSYSEDCPLYETAFSARHLFQQAQHQADIAGFYRAFGVNAVSERSDHLALELEFVYLLAVKEAGARERDLRAGIRVCRDGQRVFLREHLVRWAPLIGQRIVMVGEGTWYEVAGRLLLAFLSWEERFLRLGSIDRYRDEPVLIADEPGELTCPLLEAPTMVELSPGRTPDVAATASP